MENTINERLKKVIKELNLTPAEFGRKTCISGPHLTQLTKTTKTLTTDVLNKINQAFPHVNLDYIVNGFGDPLGIPENVERDCKMDLTPQQLEHLIKKLTNKIKDLYAEIEDTRTEIYVLRVKKVELEHLSDVNKTIETKIEEILGSKNI